MNNPVPVTLTQTATKPIGNEPIPLVVRGAIPGIPLGGITGRVLAKASNDDFDTEWVSPTGADTVWGAFYSTTTQPLTNAGQAYPVNVGLTGYAEGFSVSDGTKIVTPRDGTYDLQFSLQITSSTQQLRTLHIWLRVNGVNVEYSAGRITISEHNSVQVPTWNYFLQLSGGDQVQLMAQADGPGISIAAEPASGNYPAVPASILTINQVAL